MAKITIRDIADMANVSIGTVDRVIHKRGRVNGETRERILRIIRDTGYQPDIYASRLRKGDSIHYGIIMPRPEQDSGYWKLCLDGLVSGARDLRPQGVDVEYFLFDRFSESDITSVILRAEQAGCAGYALAPVVPGPFLEVLKRGGLGRNIVLFDTDLPGFDTFEGLHICTFIGPDNHKAGMLAGKLMNLLVAPGQPVYVVDISEGEHHLADRVRGFLDYYRNESLPEPSIITGRDTDYPEEAEKLIRGVLGGQKGDMGLFVPNATTHLYVSACERLRIHGLKTVGFDTVEKNMLLLRENKISFLLSQRPEYQASQALLNLHRAYGMKQEIADRIILPVDIVTRENC